MGVFSACFLHALVHCRNWFLDYDICHFQKIENAEDVKMLVKKEIRKAMKKEENLEKKKKKLKDRTKSSEPKEIPVPVLNLPKLEFSKPVIAKGQVTPSEICFYFY